MLDRRGALLGLMGAGVPGLARAQDVTPPPAIVAPVPPLVAAPGPVAPLPTVPVRPAVVGGAPAIDRTKVYYVFYDAQIDLVSTRALRRQLTNLVEAGVGEINLVIHSPGGLLDATLATYSLIRALPARINTHAQGIVASAACLLFLAGESRSADRNVRFMFHPTQAMVMGSLTSQQTLDRVNQFEAVDGATTQVYRDRTTLSAQEVARFGREEVIYTAEQALAGGFIQSIGDLHIPGEQKARVVLWIEGRLPLPARQMGRIGALSAG